MNVITTRMHTIIGLIVGAALIVAPQLFGFADVGGAAVMVPVWIGIIILLSEVTTTSPLSLIKLVPMRIHIMMDVVLGLVLLVSPWLFGFSDLDVNAWLPHVIVGVLVVGYALMTRTADEEVSVLE
jgi:hypothetical protein